MIRRFEGISVYAVLFVHLKVKALLRGEVQTRETEQQIRTKAYALYLASGCEPGKALEHWLAAEKQVLRGAESAEQRLRRVAVANTLAAAGGPRSS